MLYLPPYSPNLNPIEEAFAKVKALLGRAGARAHEGLVEAIGRALDAVTARDARGFFGHWGTAHRSTTVAAPKEPQQGLNRERLCEVVALGQLAAHLP